MQSSNIFIIGWRGFIGRNVISFIEKKCSHVNIYLYDKSERLEPSPFHSDKIHQVLYPEMISLLNSSKSAVVLYLANSYSPGESLKYIVSSVSENLLPFITFLDDIKKNANSIRFLFASSGGSIYGDTGGIPCNEEHHLEPKSIYAANKVAQEKYLDIFNINFGLKYISLRIANPFGPGQYAKGGQGLIPTIMQSVGLNKPVNIYGDGNSTRDYIYIDDLSECIVSASDYLGNMKIINIGSGIPRSINDIVSVFENITKIPIYKNYIPQPTSNVDSLVLDISRAKQELKWMPKTSFNQGVTEYIKWYSSNTTNPNM
jgi:UDP-glucose 4-epimerase